MLGLAGQGLVETLLLERSVLAQTVSGVSLKLRKEPKHLDVMLTGIGDSAQVVQEQSTNTSWRGEISSSDAGLSTKQVAQQVAMPEMGLASVRLSGSGNSYQLEVQSVRGKSLPKPKILANGNDLVLRFHWSRRYCRDASNRRAGFAPSRAGFRKACLSATVAVSRAVAPPLGDMAVGSMLIRQSESSCR